MPNHFYICTTPLQQRTLNKIKAHFQSTKRQSLEYSSLKQQQGGSGQCNNQISQRPSLVLLCWQKRFLFFGQAVNSAEAIQYLQQHFPDCVVFVSQEGYFFCHITLQAVIPLSVIEQYKARFQQAVQDYIQTAQSLSQLSEDSPELQDEWDMFQHGRHCRYENLNTGQWLEVPMEEALTPETIDPYFFSRFIKTTDSFSDIADLIEDEFHDSERVLHVLYPH